jgi:hypothetical protein
MKTSAILSIAFSAASTMALVIRGDIQPFQLNRVGGPDFGHTPATAPTVFQMDAAANTSNIAFWLSPVEGQNTTVFTGLTQMAATQGDIFNYGSQSQSQLFLKPDTTVNGRYMLEVGPRYTQPNTTEDGFDGFTITTSGDATYLGYNGEWEGMWSACNDQTVGENYFLYYGTAGGFSTDCKTTFNVEVTYLPGFN